MTSTLVDSNVLLDIVVATGRWWDWSFDRLFDLGNDGPLVINAIIYSEASVRFADSNSFELTLPSARFLREAIPFEAAFVAGKVHAEYRKAGGARERTLPDFFIGAHATVKGYRLLTRDARRYRTYFPKLGIIAPDSHP
jgi:predicted nucleic acid-binding protein